MISKSWLVLFCVLLTISANAIGQDLRLDKLSDCDALLQVQTALQGPVSHSCRAPRNRIEEKLISRLEATPRLRSCLLTMPPTSRFAGFSCIDVDFENIRELVCFEQIDESALQNFQNNYDAARTNRYKRAAASCPITNHDASEAKNTLFPQTLSPVAKGSFGFVVGIGDSHITSSRAYHGFGILDPTLSQTGSALEVFDMFRYKPGAKPAPLADFTDSVGDWQFEVNDLPRNSQRDFARPLEQASGERVGVRIRTITISTLHSSNTSYEDRKSDLDKWQQEIADYLIEQDFRKLTRSELAGTPFRDSDAIRNYVVKNMPFGNGAFSERFGPHLVLLVNERDDDCYKVAEVFVAEPEEGVKNDHGSVGLTVFTIGGCRRDGGPDQVLDETIHQETKLLEAR